MNETFLNSEFKALRASQDLQSGHLSPFAAAKARNGLLSAYGNATSAFAASQNLALFGAQYISASANGQVSISSPGYNSLVQTANFGDSSGYLAHLIKASATPVANTPLILKIVA